MIPFMKFNLVFVIVGFCSSVLIPDPLETKYGKIIYVSMFFRHGNRTIMNPYPNDPYRNSTLWPEGFAELTMAGKKNAFELGKWTRNRYDHLIANRPYSGELLCMNSTNLDRSLMSAQLFLAGFFPPSEQEIWDDNALLWQPIPIHPLPPFLDNVLATEASCAKYDLEVKILANSPEYRALFERNRYAFEHVAKHSGRPMTNDNVFLAIQNIINVYTCLDIEKNRGLPLPSWAKDVYPEPMKSLADLSFSAYTQTPEMKRLIGGPVLKLLFTDMNRKINDKNYKRIFQFYSGHDTTVTSLMNTLGIFNGFQPPFSSALMIELRRTVEDQHVVTIFYKNSTITEPHFLKIPACGDPCILDTLIENTKSMIPGNWEVECTTL